MGEATRGATNVTGGYAINRFFSVSVPYTRATDDSGADRSRMPVKPDIPVSAERALDEAYFAALDELEPPRADPELLQERTQASAALRQRLGMAKADGR